MSNGTALVQSLAVACATGTAVTNLVVAVAVVPFWRSLEPEPFLDWFSRYANRFGLISPPFALLGAVFSTWSLVSAGGTDARWLWGSAAALLVFTLAVLPIYFVPTNTRFYKRTIELDAVPDEVRTWSLWHWSRTVTPLLAVVLALWATTATS